jgi:hypothetical protein
MENKLDKKVELDEVKALIEENKESAATGGNDHKNDKNVFHNIHTLAPLLYPL